MTSKKLYGRLIKGASEISSGCSPVCIYKMPKNVMDENRMGAVDVPRSAE